MSGSSTAYRNGNSKYYICGQRYNASIGITPTQFNDPQIYANSVPVEQGFLSDPDSASSAIIVVNLTGRSIVVALDRPNPNARDANDDSRENQIEEGAFELPKGQSGHFNVDPCLTILNLNADVPSETGGRKTITGPGWSLSDLEDTAITIKNGVPDGLRFIVVQNANLNRFCTIFNASDHQVTVSIKRSESVFGRATDQEEKEKSDRRPDMGDDPKFSRVLKAGGKLHLDSPAQVYKCRALQTNVQTDQPADGYFVSDEVVPSVDDYVEYVNAAADAVAGQVVVFLLDTDGETIVSQVLDDSEVKYVTQKIVWNE